MSVECERSDGGRRYGEFRMRDSASEGSRERGHFHSIEKIEERYEKRLREKLDRKKKVRRQWEMIVGLTVLFFVVVAGVVSLGMKAEKTGAKKNFPDKADRVQEAVSKGVQEREEAEETRETLEQKVERVRAYAQGQGYPDEVIELLSKNPETVQFVEEYGEKKNRAPAGTIGTVTPGEIPLILQWDERWGYSKYGDSIIAVSGCGPTCMAMVIAGLTQDSSVTPVALAEYGTNNHYLDEDNNTYWGFMREAGSVWGVSCYETYLTEEELAAELGKGRPVVCSVGQGFFTQMGHFMVITDYKEGSVKINDPFSIENSSRWWKYSDISGQIQGMWVYYVE